MHGKQSAAEIHEVTTRHHTPHHTQQQQRGRENEDRFSIFCVCVCVMMMSGQQNNSIVVPNIREDNIDQQE
jgi:hypothetical protein